MVANNLLWSNAKALLIKDASRDARGQLQETYMNVTK